MAFIRLYKSSDFEATAHIVSSTPHQCDEAPSTALSRCAPIRGLLVDKQGHSPRTANQGLTSHLQCRDTLASSLVGSEPAERLAPYLWTHQYTHLSPSTCFVLDDGQGRAVGYCIGTPDIDTFMASYQSYVEKVLEPSSEITRPADITTGRELWTLPDGTVNETCLAQTAYNPTWLVMGGNEDVYAAGYQATMHIDILEPWQGGGWGRKLIEALIEAVGREKREGTRGLWIGAAKENRKVIPFYERMGFRMWEDSVNGLRMVRDIPLRQ